MKLVFLLIAYVLLFIAVFSAVGVLVFDGSDQSGRSALGLTTLIVLPLAALGGWLSMPWLAK